MAVALEATDGIGVSQQRFFNRAGDGPMMSGLAATLRETDPGTKVRMEMRDGSEVSGTVGDGELVSLDDGGVVELRQVRRVVLEFGEPKQRRAGGRPKQAA